MHRKHITQNPVRLRFHSYSSQCCRRRCLHISTDNIYANGTFMGGIYCVFRSADVLWIWWTNTLWPYDVRISWRRWHWIIAHGKFPRDKLLFSIENLDWLVFFFCFRWMHVCSPTSLLILRNRIAMHWFFNHFFFFFRLTNDDEPISGEIRLHWSALFWNFRFSAFHLITSYRQREADFILKPGAGGGVNERGGAF